MNKFTQSSGFSACKFVRGRVFAFVRLSLLLPLLLAFAQPAAGQGITNPEQVRIGNLENTPDTFSQAFGNSEGPDRNTTLAQKFTTGDPRFSNTDYHIREVNWNYHGHAGNPGDLEIRIHAVSTSNPVVPSHAVGTLVPFDANARRPRDRGNNSHTHIGTVGWTIDGNSEYFVVWDPADAPRGSGTQQYSLTLTPTNNFDADSTQDSGPGQSGTIWSIPHGYSLWTLGSTVAGHGSGHAVEMKIVAESAIRPRRRGPAAEDITVNIETANPYFRNLDVAFRDGNTRSIDPTTFFAYCGKKPSDNGTNTVARADIVGNSMAIRYFGGGTTNCKFGMRDSTGREGRDDIDVTVIVPPPAQPPAFAQTNLPQREFEVGEDIGVYTLPLAFGGAPGYFYTIDPQPGTPALGGIGLSFNGVDDSGRPGFIRTSNGPTITGTPTAPALVYQLAGPQAGRIIGRSWNYQVLDRNGLSRNRVIDMLIWPSNTAPVITGGNRVFRVDENAAGNIGAPVTATDADATLMLATSDGGQTIVPWQRVRYSLRGNDAGRFRINDSGQISAGAFDFEDRDQYEVEVIARDDHPLRPLESDPVTVTININDVAEPPGPPDAPRLSPGTPAQTEIVAAWDPPGNSGPAITGYDVEYKLASDPDSSYTGSGVMHRSTDTTATIGNLLASAVNNLRFYNVRVRAINEEGTGDWSAVARHATERNDVNTPPQVRPIPVQEREVPAGQTFVSTLGLSSYFFDPDGDVLTYTVPSNPVATLADGTLLRIVAPIGDPVRVTVMATDGPQANLIRGMTPGSVTQSFYVSVIAEVPADATLVTPIQAYRQNGRGLSIPELSAGPDVKTEIDARWRVLDGGSVGAKPVTYELRYRICPSAACTSPGPWKLSRNSVIRDVVRERDGRFSAEFRQTTIQGLRSETLYQVQVRARTEDGVSGWSQSSRAFETAPIGANSPPRPITVDMIQTIGPQTITTITPLQTVTTIMPLQTVTTITPAQTMTTIRPAQTVTFTEVRRIPQQTLIVEGSPGNWTTSTIALPALGTYFTDAEGDQRRYTAQVTQQSTVSVNGESVDDAVVEVRVHVTEGDLTITALAPGSAYILLTAEDKPTSGSAGQAVQGFAVLVHCSPLVCGAGDGDGDGEVDPGLLLTPNLDPLRPSDGDPSYVPQAGGALPADANNQAPVAEGRIPMQATGRGEAMAIEFDVAGYFRDPDGDALHYRVDLRGNEHIAHASIGPTSSVLRIQGIEPGRFSASVIADDNGNSEDGEARQEVLVVIEAGDVSAASALITPQATRVAIDAAAAAVSGRVSAVAGASLPSASLNGLSLTDLADGKIGDAASWMRRREGLLQGGDWKELLRDSEFALPLNASGDGLSGLLSGDVSVWGSGEYRNIGGEGDSHDDLDWDGSLTGFHLGVDTRVRPEMLMGMAVSLLDGDLDYKQNGSDGDYGLAMRTFSPYIAWDEERMSGWASVGFGEGDVEVTPDDSGKKRSGDADLRTVAIGINGRIADNGRTEVRLRGELLNSRMEVSGDREVANDSDANRVRLGLVAKREGLSRSGGVLKREVSAGLRSDSGDGNSGTGAEFGGGVTLVNEPFEFDGRVRLLAGHSGDAKEWGVSGGVRMKPGLDGQGLQLSLRPGYGSATDSRVDALWEKGVGVGGIGGETDAREYAMRVESRVQYGLRLQRSGGLLTPFMEATHSEKNSIRLGVDRRTDLGRDSWLNLGVSGERNGDEGRVLLKGEVGF